MAESSFDVVSSVDLQEVKNAISQAMKEITTRFDLKGTKLKVQASIQGDQVRVSGKNRDDLQAVIRLLKGTDLGIDMQFTNYR